MLSCFPLHARITVLTQWVSREREEEGRREVGRREGGRGGEGRGEREEEENEDRMVGEVEVRCVGPGMQGVCVCGGVCTYLLVFFSDAKTLARLGAVSAERLTCPCGIVFVVQRLLRC